MELIVRHLTRSMGYRYKLHDRSLLRTPDLVFPFPSLRNFCPRLFLASPQGLGAGKCAAIECRVLAAKVGT
ncbi:MAG TPA: hypothetical protein VKS22_02130 [Candidatus Binataceae bacterium]|nr:hypothetical protein [Candidatus Binataceae bacterium]